MSIATASLTLMTPAWRIVADTGTIAPTQREAMRRTYEQVRCLGSRRVCGGTSALDLARPGCTGVQESRGDRGMEHRLKSNSGGEEATAAVRAYEAALVIEGLKKLAPTAKDSDVLLLGDVNTLRGNAPVIGALSSIGLKDCNVRNLKTYVGGPKPAPFDRIFLVRDQPETAGSCLPQGDGSKPRDFRVVRPQDWMPSATIKGFMSKLSDHLMVRAGFCVTEDDD